jgi:hypothetical protein
VALAQLAGALERGDRLRHVAAPDVQRAHTQEAGDRRLGQ